ncbi:MAG TPA: isochorismatase family protein [Ferrovibrio sp.]|uniref:isochorismatase family protein n=1 Tax=Ferrovibrio sp. TaxID=1917215 RepID=UPI002ED64C83
MTLLSAAQSLLLIVDIQDRLLPAMQDGEAVVRNSAILLQASGKLGIPALLTEQYRKGLGGTVAAVAEVAAGAPVCEKMHFSAYADPAIRGRIEQFGRKRIVIAGIEAHVCVLQTALDLIAGDYDVFVVADAIASRRRENVELARQRLGMAGVALVSTEMCLFEWLETASHAQFKALSQLIK